MNVTYLDYSKPQVQAKPLVQADNDSTYVDDKSKGGKLGIDPFEADHEKMLYQLIKDINGESSEDEIKKEASKPRVQFSQSSARANIPKHPVLAKPKESIGSNGS